MGKVKRPFCCHKIFVLNGLSAPAWGYIHLEKKEEAYKKNNNKKTKTKKKINGKKSDFQEIFLNWQQMDKVIRNFF